MTEFNSPYAFVIDTEQYAGNFERELCAYVTGQVGECGVGVEAAEQFKAEEPKQLLEAFEEAVVSMPDDHGCFRPASIFPTPRWYNDGNGKHFRGSPSVKKRWPAYLSVAIWFNEKPSKKLIQTMKRRADMSCSMNHRLQGLSEIKFKITGFRLLSQRRKIEEIPT